MSKVKVSLFAQLLELVDRVPFNKLVASHNTDKHNKGFDTWSHLVSMLFMQISGVNSLRDISNGLRSASGNLNHLGVVQAPSKSTISYQNKHRDYTVFMELLYKLLDKYEPSLARKKQYARRLKRKIFIMYSSIIPLSLSLFDWAQFRTSKGALKLHAVLDYDTGLPNYACITDGKQHNVTIAKQTSFPRKSVLVVDRAYVDMWTISGYIIWTAVAYSSSHDSNQMQALSL